MRNANLFTLAILDTCYAPGRRKTGYGGNLGARKAVCERNQLLLTRGVLSKQVKTHFNRRLDHALVVPRMVARFNCANLP